VDAQFHEARLDESPDAAAEAFEALQAEVRRVREVVEGLPAALEPIDTKDYAPTLGAIAKSLAAIEQHPALRLTPEAFVAQLRQVRETAQEQGRRELTGAAQRLDAASAAMERLVAGERGARQQDKWLAITGAVAAVGGVLLWVALSGPIARAMPAAWHVPETMAAATLHLDRWNAGARLMASADPRTWAEITSSVELVRKNQTALDVCRRAAARTGKPQRCVMVVAPVN
jgi:hypothetical protein